YWPRVRVRKRETCAATWLEAGWLKPSNWSSTTGRQPAMQSPTARPTIPASASGVSKTRRSPNSVCRPSVTRKTPPSRPTSSPNTSTRSSSPSPARSASRSAPCIVSSVKPVLLEPFAALGERRGRRLLVHERELLLERRRLDRQHPFPQPLDLGGCLALDLVEEAGCPVLALEATSRDDERIA